VFDEKFEIAINRYLDGDLSESEFETMLRRELPDIDIGSFRSFRERVERIEFLYASIEDPEVPDGYWDSFSSRVVESLPAETKAERGRSILDILLPWRWPKPSYGYAGAVAVAVFAFLIGKSMIEKDSSILQPREESKEVSQPMKIEEPLQDDGYVTLDSIEPGVDMAIPPAPEGDAEEESVEPVIGVADEVTSESGETPIAVKDKPKDYLTETEIADNLAATAPAQELAGVDGGAIRKAGEDRALDKGRTKADAEVEISTEMAHEPPVELDESITYFNEAKREIGVSTKSALQALSAGGVADSDSWNLAYVHNMEEDDLRNRLAEIADSLSDSLQISDGYSEFTYLKYSLALKTRDTVDIYDAMNTIDTLLMMNPRILGKDAWMHRQDQLRGLTGKRP